MDINIINTIQLHNLYDKIINNYKMCTKYLNLNNYNKTWIHYKLNLI